MYLFFSNVFDSAESNVLFAGPGAAAKSFGRPFAVMRASSVVPSAFGERELSGRRTGITTPMKTDDFRIVVPEACFAAGYGNSLGWTGAFARDFGRLAARCFFGEGEEEMISSSL